MRYLILIGLVIGFIASVMHSIIRKTGDVIARAVFWPVIAFFYALLIPYYTGVGVKRLYYKIEKNIEKACKKS